MADKDELARMLGAMAEGQHAEPEAEQEAADAPDAEAAMPALPTPRPVPAPSTPKPPPPRVPSTIIPPRSANAPPVPTSIRHTLPTPQPGPAASEAPSLPPRPKIQPAKARPNVAVPLTPPSSAAPRPRVTPPPPSKPPQMAPPPPSPEPAFIQPQFEEPVADEQVQDADDLVNIPVPSPQALAPRKRATPLHQAQLAQKLALRRTLIPPLLTLGVICPGLVLLGFQSASDSPFRVMSQWWFAAPFIGIGVVFLLMAAVTMLHVKHELDRHRESAQ